MRTRVRAATVLAALLCAICQLPAPAPAWATQDPGLHVDPSSPVAKAYALPLGSARAAPTGGPSSGGLFGAGITASTHEPGSAGPSALGRPHPSATPAAYRVLRPGSGAGLLWMVIAGVAVLALGSAAGFALRRRR